VTPPVQAGALPEHVSWFALSLAAAGTQATQFAVIKGRARDIPPVVIVAWTNAVAFTAWVTFFLMSGHAFAAPRSAWPAIAACAVLVTGMSGLLARASARGDIGVVGPMLALSPVFTVLPDAVLSGTLPSSLGWLGLGLSVVGTTSLSGGATFAGRLHTLLRRRDALDALGAAFLLGFLGAVDRWGALALGPPSYLMCTHGATTLLTTTIALCTTPRGLAVSEPYDSLSVAPTILALTGNLQSDNSPSDILARRGFVKFPGRVIFEVVGQKFKPGTGAPAQ